MSLAKTIIDCECWQSSARVEREVAIRMIYNAATFSFAEPISILSCKKACPSPAISGNREMYRLSVENERYDRA
jgi:hypothetical protein